LRQRRFTGFTQTGNRCTEFANLLSEAAFGQLRQSVLAIIEQQVGEIRSAGDGRGQRQQ